MTPISQFLPVLQPSKIKSEWQATIKSFVDLTSLKPSFIAKRIAPFKNDHTAIHLLLKELNNARNKKAYFIARTK
jgi:hypothetical protein